MSTGYVTVRDVPILDEHTLLDDAGNALLNIDANRLRVIAQRANTRIRQTGDLVPIVIGHTKDNAPEQQQPEIVGYAGPFNIGPFFNTGKKALKALFKFFKNKLNKIRQFPRRSVELWLSDLRIDPISLLGATTPERDLGLLRLSREGKRVYRRVLPSQTGESVDNVQEIVDAVLAALEESDVWKWAKEQMNEGQYPKEGEEEAMGLDDLGVQGEGEEDAEMPGEEAAGVGSDEEAGIPPEEAEMPPKKGEKPLKMGAGAPAASMPSGSNSYVPGGLERKRMARDQASTLRHRYERRLQAQEQETQDLRRKLQRSNRERDLIQLESEGVMLDRVEELDAVEKLDDADYTKYLGRLKKRYSKAPIGGVSWNIQHERGESQAGISRDQALEIADYAAKKGIGYLEAKKQMLGTE
jgi:hypothetical protein